MSLKQKVRRHNFDFDLFLSRWNHKCLATILTINNNFPWNKSLGERHGRGPGGQVPADLQPKLNNTRTRIHIKNDKRKKTQDLNTLYDH